MTGYDDEGLFYAAQTLLQLAEKTPSGVTIPQVEVLDWPDVPFHAALLKVFTGCRGGRKAASASSSFTGSTR